MLQFWYDKQRGHEFIPGGERPDARCWCESTLPGIGDIGPGMRRDIDKLPGGRRISYGPDCQAPPDSLVSTTAKLYQRLVQLRETNSSDGDASLLSLDTRSLPSFFFYLCFGVQKTVVFLETSKVFFFKIILY